MRTEGGDVEQAGGGAGSEAAEIQTRADERDLYQRLLHNLLVSQARDTVIILWVFTIMTDLLLEVMVGLLFCCKGLTDATCPDQTIS